MQTYDIKTISSTSFGYPAQLAILRDAPQTLYTRGNIDLLLNNSNYRKVAIIGSRRASPYGKQITQELVQQLVRHNIIIVSGLAFGIDATAHRATIQSNGHTIAVIPADLHNIYPRSHANLAQDIMNNNGLIISEHKNHPYIQPFEFIKRNRIIAAMSDLVVVIEATQKSGSLGTATVAAGLGKTVGVIPGNITSPTSVGTNQLLHQGAQPILSYKDVLSLLNITEQTQLPLTASLSKLQKQIMAQLQNNRLSATSLVRILEFDIANINTELTTLELLGHIKQSDDQLWTSRYV